MHRRYNKYTKSIVQWTQSTWNAFDHRSIIPSAFKMSKTATVEKASMNATQTNSTPTGRVRAFYEQLKVPTVSASTWKKWRSMNFPFVQSLARRWQNTSNMLMPNKSSLSIQSGLMVKRLTIMVSAAVLAVMATPLGPYISGSGAIVQYIAPYVAIVAQNPLLLLGGVVAVGSALLVVYHGPSQSVQWVVKNPQSTARLVLVSKFLRRPWRVIGDTALFFSAFGNQRLQWLLAFAMLGWIALFLVLKFDWLFNRQ